MAQLRLRYEAECLTSQITKRNLGGQPLRRLIETTLPRERFSPLADTRRTLLPKPDIDRQESKTNTPTFTDLDPLSLKRIPIALSGVSHYQWIGK
jgi:hypothetical protein